MTLVENAHLLTDLGEFFQASDTAELNLFSLLQTLIDCRVVGINSHSFMLL